MTLVRWSSADALQASATGDTPPATEVSLVAIDQPSPTLDLGFLAGQGFVVASVGTANPTADVVVGDHEVAELATRCAANPQAAAVAAQQLRLAEQLPAEAALISESLAYATLQAGAEHQRWLDKNNQRRRVRPATSTPPVIVTDDGARVELQLNRPRLKNAFTTEMRNELHAILQALNQRPELESVEISGVGKHFCIGGDLAEFGAVQDPATAHAIRLASSVARQLVACPAVVNFRVHGAVVGAGFELAAFGQTVTATNDATFSLPELEMGLLPGAGGTVSLTHRIGRQAAARLLLIDRAIDAEQALRLGLIDQLAD